MTCEEKRMEDYRRHQFSWHEFFFLREEKQRINSMGDLLPWHVFGCRVSAIEARNIRSHWLSASQSSHYNQV